MPKATRRWARVIKRVLPRQNEAVNETWICDKGRFGHHFAGSPDRLTTPLVRQNGELKEATWAEALKLVGEKLKAALLARSAAAMPRRSRTSATG